MHPLERRHRHRRVDRRRLQALVPQHLLDEAHIAARFQEVRRERMPEQVATAALRDPRRVDVLPQLGAQPAAAEALAADVEEEEAVVRLHHQRRAYVGEIAVDPRQRVRAERHEAVLLPLPLAHQKKPTVALDVVELEVGEFGAAQPGRIQHLKHSPIAQAFGGGEVGLREHRRDLFARQDRPRQMLHLARQFQIRRRIPRQMPALHAPPEEATQAGQPRVLPTRRQRLPASVAVLVEQPALIPRHHRRRRLRGVDDAALFRPLDEQPHRPLAQRDRLSAEVPHRLVIEPRRHQRAQRARPRPVGRDRLAPARRVGDMPGAVAHSPTTAGHRYGTMAGAPAPASCSFPAATGQTMRKRGKFRVSGRKTAPPEGPPKPPQRGPKGPPK